MKISRQVARVEAWPGFLHSRSQSRFPFELSAAFICDIIAIIKEEEGTFRPKWITLNFNQFSIVFNSEQEKEGGGEGEGRPLPREKKKRRRHTAVLRRDIGLWPPSENSLHTSARGPNRASGFPTISRQEKDILRDYESSRSKRNKINNLSLRSFARSFDDTSGKF